MKKFLSIALSLVMLTTSATNLNVALAKAPESGIYLNQKNQLRKTNLKKQENKSQNSIVGAVMAGVCVVGGVSLLGFRAMQNKKLDGTKWQDNWNNPNKTTTQKYLDAIKILLFGDPTRKAVEKAEEKRNRANQTVNNLDEELKSAETVKSNAEKVKIEAENKKKDIDKSVDLIKNGGKDEKGNNVKSLETLRNEEKTAKETSVNATTARKEAEEDLFKAMKAQKEADKKLKIADREFNVTVAQFNKINEKLNNKENGANAELIETKKNYKEICEQNGWHYNTETDKCESPAPCGNNAYHNEEGKCTCTKNHVLINGQCEPKATCGENENYNPQSNTCDGCIDGYVSIDGKCVAKATCGENEN